MYWEQEKRDNDKWKVSEDIVDLSFSIRCKMLPLDHAYAFSKALQQALPWLTEEVEAGVHLIHGAESGNGWNRPDDTAGQMLHLSRRTRMALRVPNHRVDAARQLTGQTLDIDGCSLEVGEANTKLLSSLPTLFSRYVICEEQLSEEEFLEQVVEEMRKLPIQARKVMAGRSHALAMPEKNIFTRAIMIADLDPEHAVLLQQRGIGPGRKMGCGLFIPHKGIESVGKSRGDD